jgi:hypothetical protein
LVLELGTATKDKKEKREQSCHAIGCAARWRKLSDMSAVAVARAGVSDKATAKVDAAAEGSRLQVLAWLQEVESGSNKQPGGQAKIAQRRG